MRIVPEPRLMRIAHLHRRRRRPGSQRGHPGGGALGTLPGLEGLRHPARLRRPALLQRRRAARSRRVRGITHLGGTILGTTNRGNPVPLRHADADGNEYEVDRSDDLVAAFQASGFDALVSIGGDGSLQISHELWCKGLPVVCVPKTIDNDVAAPSAPSGSTAP